MEIKMQKLKSKMQKSNGKIKIAKCEIQNAKIWKMLKFQ